MPKKCCGDVEGPARSIARSGIIIPFFSLFVRFLGAAPPGAQGPIRPADQDACRVALVVVLQLIAAGYALGVWGVGALAARMRAAFVAGQQRLRFLVTLLGSGLGLALLLLTPPAGFLKAVYPLAGALLGYYLAGLFIKH